MGIQGLAFSILYDDIKGAFVQVQSREGGKTWWRMGMEKTCEKVRGRRRCDAAAITPACDVFSQWLVVRIWEIIDNGACTLGGRVRKGLEGV